MEPRKEAQWTWPDTPAYLKAYKLKEMEAAKTTRSINRLFLAFGIALAIEAAFVIFFVFYCSTHK